MILDKIPSVKGSVPERSQTKTALVLLTERLRELGAQVSGLPTHAVDKLRTLIEKEVATAQADLAIGIAELEQQSVEHIRKRVAKVITDSSVSEAWKRRPSSGSAETPDSTPPPVTGAQGGAA